METAAFLQRLKKVTRSSDGWSALCPAHDDRDPSLSVTEKNGKILVHCHASPPCTIEAICAALDISKADLYTDRTEIVGPGLGAPVAVYEYQDEWGRPLFKKNRYATASGKTFRIQRHTETGWAWGIKDVRRVLYRLPELLEAIHQRKTVYVVDGEKDANSLWELGYPATCDPMGSGKWRSEYGDVLAQAPRVMIVADREEGGLEQASTVAFSLSGRTEYEIVESAVGKDVSDHLKAGRSVEELIPVGGLADLLTQVETFIRRFVVLTEEQSCAVTLWVAHCWALDAAYSTPYLHVTSAEEESGKTRLLEVLELLVPEPILAADITEAALYRVIDQKIPTLFLDEVDAVFSKKKDKDGTKDVFRSLLNAGYRRGMKVYRAQQNGGSALDEFEVFCPKALAGLGDLPRTLASRSIRIQMQRRAQDEPVEDFFRQDLEGEAEAFQEKLLTWRERSVETLASLRPLRVHGLRDRANEVWRPLLSISSTGGGIWEVRGRGAAATLSQAGIEPSYGILLLEDIHRIMVEEHDFDRLSTTELLDWLYLIEESPWAEWWKDGKGGPRGIAKLLKPYGILSRTIRIEGATVKGYMRESFVDAWTRLLAPDLPPGKSVTASQPPHPSDQAKNGRGKVNEVTDIPSQPSLEDEGGWG